VLPVLFLSGAAVGALAAVAARRARRLRGSSAVGAPAALVMVVGCLVAQLGIAPRIERLRADAGAPIDALPRTDARRVAFGRLHGASVLALGVSMLASAAALAVGVRGAAAPEGRSGTGGTT